MDFDDSLFAGDGTGGEDDGNKKLSGEKTSSNITYTAKICYPEWFMGGVFNDNNDDVDTSDEETHVILKYRADLCYYRQQYRQAIDLYLKILKILPSTNRVVQREVVDSLVRCHLRLDQFTEALSHAMKTLVVPPHENDASSWQLVADCYKGLGEPYFEDYVLCLQRSILAQRHSTSSWLQLADAFNTLSTATSSSSPPDLSSILGISCSINSITVRHHQQQEDDPDEGKLEAIFRNVVTLFRPYFKWKTEKEDDEEKGIILDEMITVSRLLGRQISARDFVDSLNQLPWKQSQNLMQILFSMCHHCCLIWARQLQIYSVRHSNSFAQPVEREELEKIEYLLESCNKDGEISVYLTQCFNHPSIFEDSS